MQVASRPRFAAGVALVGASVVVASTVSPVRDIHLPDIHLPAIRTAEINLAAAVNPLEVYVQVLQNAVAGADTLGQECRAGAGPQADTRQPAQQPDHTRRGHRHRTDHPGAPASANRGRSTCGGQSGGATDALLQIPLAVGLPALPTLIKPLQNVMNVINAFTADPLGTELLLSGFIAPADDTGSRREGDARTSSLVRTATRRR